MHKLVDLLKLGPTSANCSPARFLFVKSREAKEKLKPHLSEGNRDKTMKAPVCTIVGYDLDFYEYLPKLFPHTDAKSWFEGTAMSGFDNAGVDRDFFAGTNIKSNFLCNLGYGDGEKLFPRLPRFDFDEMAKII